jgi:broad specificity phosphatase PhoE
MYMNIFLARHGQSTANLKDLLSGQVGDYGLTDLGQKHAEVLRDYLLDKGVQHVFSSDLRRVRETVKPFLETTNTPITYDLRLREMHFGILEDADKQIRNSSIHWQKRQRDYIRYRIPEGENYEDVVVRTGSFLQDLHKTPFERVLIAGHELSNKSLLYNLLHFELKTIIDVQQQNHIVYHLDTQSLDCNWYNTMTGEKGTGLLFNP